VCRDSCVHVHQIWWCSEKMLGMRRWICNGRLYIHWLSNQHSRNSFHLCFCKWAFELWIKFIEIQSQQPWGKWFFTILIISADTCAITEVSSKQILPKSWRNRFVQNYLQCFRIVNLKKKWAITLSVPNVMPSTISMM
jgi:hypothetical protein